MAGLATSALQAQAVTSSSRNRKVFIPHDTEQFKRGDPNEPLCGFFGVRLLRLPTTAIEISATADMAKALRRPIDPALDLRSNSAAGSLIGRLGSADLGE